LTPENFSLIRSNFFVFSSLENLKLKLEDSFAGELIGLSGLAFPDVRPALPDRFGAFAELDSFL